MDAIWQLASISSAFCVVELYADWLFYSVNLNIEVLVKLSGDWARYSFKRKIYITHARILLLFQKHKKKHGAVLPVFWSKDRWVIRLSFKFCCHLYRLVVPVVCLKVLFWFHLFLLFKQHPFAPILLLVYLFLYLYTYVQKAIWSQGGHILYKLMTLALTGKLQIFWLAGITTEAEQRPEESRWYISFYSSCTILIQKCLN